MAPEAIPKATGGVGIVPRFESSRVIESGGSEPSGTGRDMCAAIRRPLAALVPRNRKASGAVVGVFESNRAGPGDLSTAPADLPRPGAPSRQGLGAVVQSTEVPASLEVRAPRAAVSQAPAKTGAIGGEAARAGDSFSFRGKVATVIEATDPQADGPGELVIAIAEKPAASAPEVVEAIPPARPARGHIQVYTIEEELFRARWGWQAFDAARASIIRQSASAAPVQTNVF